jgi:glyoxylase-like metal-dependent hydrolase (beta-lactamase superfamily II)/ferredoxin
MADPKKPTRGNVPGAFFVDTTCIDCDTCRQLAPDTFQDNGTHSFVLAQPADDVAERAALHALLACPTGSIGTRGPNLAKEVVHDFPMPIATGVSYCGFTSQHSFGGSSYFVEHPEGNWLIDSPKFTTHLVRAFESRGGLARIFLTHQDDVADAARYAAHFKAERIIHERELQAQPDAEIVIHGEDPIALHAEFTVIPTPGHTAGHCVLLHAPRSTSERYLFSGDHIWWSRNKRRVWASREVCWHSWDEQIRSVERLIDVEFNWLLPGHGERRSLPASHFRMELERLVHDMRAGALAH